MYTTCRVYSDARELADLIISNQSEVEKLLRAVPGFNSYYLVHTDDGFTSITICDTKEGAEQSNKVAAEWVRVTESAFEVLRQKSTLARHRSVSPQVGPPLASRSRGIALQAMSYCLHIPAIGPEPTLDGSRNIA